jgi:hypothetical protein
MAHLRLWSRIARVTEIQTPPKRQIWGTTNHVPRREVGLVFMATISSFRILRKDPDSLEESPNLQGMATDVAVLWRDFLTCSLQTGLKSFKLASTHS